jgi:hypothetical protein
MASIIIAGRGTIFPTYEEDAAGLKVKIALEDLWNK